MMVVVEVCKQKRGREERKGGVGKVGSGEEDKKYPLC